MPTFINLEQGTAEWHKHRKLYRNASETAAVMGLSPWTTPYELWLIKTGRKIQPENEAMRHGTAIEPLARVAYESGIGNIMQPKVVVDSKYSASLDGLTLNGDLLLEIKCPFQGNKSELWSQVQQGIVPEHYHLQVQHQLMVSGAKLAHLYVFDGKKGINLAIRPDLDPFKRIQLAWDNFQRYLDTDTPPPLTEQDTVLREDNEWGYVAGMYVSLKAQADVAAKQADDAKAELIKIAQHNRETGFGVTVTRYYKQGSVDYKLVPELGAINLDQYRGQPKEEVRVTVVKEKATC